MLQIKVALIEWFFRCIGYTPKSIATRTANVIGTMWYGLDAKHRRIAFDNLTRAFGSEKSTEEIRRLARKTFQNLSLVVFEIGWSLRLTPEQITHHVDLKGKAHFEAAVAKNRGVLVITAHTGNWEMLTNVAVLGLGQFNVLYRPLDAKALDQFFVNLRTRFGNAVIPKNSPLLKITRCLRRGESVVMLMDQNVGWRRGVFVDFFGHTASTNKAMAYFAVKLSVPVVPVFIARTAKGFVAEVGPEIPLVKTGDMARDIEDNTQNYNHAIEAFIRRYPDQWLWVHQRWKTKGYKAWPRQKRQKKRPRKSLIQRLSPFQATPWNGTH